MNFSPDPCCGPLSSWPSWTPSRKLQYHSTVQFESRYVISCTTCAMLSHPARVESAYWKGLASSNLVMNCFARVFATNLLMTSPTTIPWIPPICLCRAVVWPFLKAGTILREASPCESLGNLEELGPILSIGEVGASDRCTCSCCSPTCGLQIVRNLSLSNSRGLEEFAALSSSGMGSVGNGGRLSMSLRAFKVSSVPGATGDPSSAWSAAETQTHQNLGTFNTFGDCVMLGASPSRTQLAGKLPHSV